MSSLVEPSDGATKLRTVGLSKSFTKGGRRVEAIRDIGIDVKENEFISIIGPSGCGKSTLFNIIAGLELPDRGCVEVDDRDTTGRPEACAYMPQKDLLFPWRSVIDNTILGLQIAGVPKAEARRKADPFFEIFGIAGTQKLYPFQLSGGMRQRAALLRTVIQGREVLLLDEPFGALDALTKSELKVWEAERWTVILVTHDIREAIYLSDRVYVMTPSPGRIQDLVQIDLPRPRMPAVIQFPEFAAYEARLTQALRGRA